MKATTFLSVFPFAIPLGYLLVAACGPAGNAIVRSVIDVGLAACIAENADISDEAALRETCKWADAVAPLVRDLLAARTKGVSKAAKAGACAPGTSAPDGGK